MPAALSPTDQRIRDALRAAMDGSSPRVTQQALADRLGVSQPAVAAMLAGRRGQVPQSLIDMLEALGLEIVVQPKQQPVQQHQPSPTRSDLP
ncbi:helix-turn-helix domain-containing protein [Deinococcus budaensis]|uniref:Putative transcriptional regulator n=1 Tax=Deinococcus budaensis TaxID=1665626 RepID=A0A7W8LQ63_9DEIO|nr:helix-turn-helix transcriptional regulator [Deinococcus budaensis]MBB5234513.1 putative transcriptional regulator [Deinococcus budaensis]